jgi:hypothetical protein
MPVWVGGAGGVGDPEPGWFVVDDPDPPCAR